MTPKPTLHLNPTFPPWVTISMSRPSPMSLQYSTNSPLHLVLTMVHYLLLISLSHPVFACSKHLGPPAKWSGLPSQQTTPPQPIVPNSTLPLDTTP